MVYIVSQFYIILDRGLTRSARPLTYYLGCLTQKAIGRVLKILIDRFSTLKAWRGSHASNFWVDSGKLLAARSRLGVLETPIVQLIRLLITTK